MMTAKKIYPILILLFLILIPTFLISQDIQYARQTIKKLASPGMKGRGYVNHGSEKAARFIAGEYRKNNLDPFGGSYFQEFEFPVNTFPDEVTLKIDGKFLSPGKDFIPAPGSPSLSGIFETYTISADRFSDLSGLFGFMKSNGGRIPLIDYGKYIQTGDSARNFLSAFEAFVEKDSLLEIPAVAFVNYKHLVWSVSTKRNATAVIYIRDPVDPDISHQVDIRLSSRFVPSYRVRNVLGFLPGKMEPDSFIVVTAHYDHLGMLGKNTYFPGANDNASGTALMLDLARHFSAVPGFPKYSLLFISFAGEEAGLQGSMYLVDHPPFDLSLIKFLINLDLAGTGDEGIMVVNATEFTHEFDFLRRYNERHTLLPAVKSRGEACNSDHCPFYARGVKCFFIYTLGGIQAYHDIYDRFETLPLSGYSGYFHLMAAFIQHLNK